MTENAYEALYRNMKNRFTVVSGNNEYTLGGYMRMKAKEQTENTALPMEIQATRPTALRAVASYINEKLLVKELPAPEKTTRAFPFRAALAALCSALLLSSVVVSFAAIPKNTETAPSSYAAEQQEKDDEKADERYTTYTENR
ncbi:MAG TPA: hypothetical protein DDY70_04825 [Clostridiales bacterium]|nr:hypothetical protein [Clostridiales bacterium]